jgi:hypothetical protein
MKRHPELVQVVATLRSPGDLTGRLYRRYQDSGEQPNDPNRHDEFK